MPGFHNKRKFKRKRRKNGLGKVKRDIKWLKKNIEFKFLDTDINSLDTGFDSPLVFPLNLLPQNVGASGRIGDEVTARRIAIRGFVHNDNGTPQDCIVRIILFRQIRVNGVTALLSDLLEDTTSSRTVNSWRNMQNKTNFKVLFDSTFTMDTLTHTLLPFKLMYKLNHQVEYDSTAATIANAETNQLYLVGISTVTGSVNSPNITGSARYSYVDG